MLVEDQQRLQQETVESLLSILGRSFPFDRFLIALAKVLPIIFHKANKIQELRRT